MALPRLTVQNVIPQMDIYGMVKDAKNAGAIPSALRALGTVGKQYASNDFQARQQAKAEQLVREYYARTGDYATQPEEILQMAETAQPSMQGMSPEFLPKLPSQAEPEVPFLPESDVQIPYLPGAEPRPDESTLELMGGLNPTLLPRLGVERETTPTTEPTQTASAPAPMRQLGTPQQSEGEARALYLQRLMGIDPNRATVEQRRLEGTDAQELAQMKAMADMAKDGDPESRRMRIGALINTLNGVRSAALASQQLDLAASTQKQIAELEKEMAKDDPRAQEAYKRIYGGDTGDAPKAPPAQLKAAQDIVNTRLDAAINLLQFDPETGVATPESYDAALKEIGYTALTEEGQLLGGAKQSTELAKDRLKSRQEQSKELIVARQRLKTLALDDSNKVLAMDQSRRTEEVKYAPLVATATTLADPTASPGAITAAKYQVFSNVASSNRENQERFETVIRGIVRDESLLKELDRVTSNAGGLLTSLLGADQAVRNAVFDVLKKAPAEDFLVYANRELPSKFRVTPKTTPAGNNPAPVSDKNPLGLRLSK